MITQLRSLYDARRFEECYASLDAAVAANPSDGRLLRDVAVFLVERSVYFKFDAAISMLDRYLAGVATDPSAYQAHAFACWVKKDMKRCVESCQRAIALNHEQPHAYRILGMHHLSEQRYYDAFFVLSTGMLFCPDKQSLTPWLVLATSMIKGVKSVDLEFDGIPFTFGLTCFNSMAMSSTATHLSRTMNEPEELRLIRSEIGRCRSIVEVGCLVGNHTLFFAKALQPERILVLDANRHSLEQTRANFALNWDVAHVELDLRHRAIGEAAGEIEMFGQTVSVSRIDDEATGDVDFVKVDVDGMEMAALNGMRRLIERCRPRILIEISNEFVAEFRTFLEAVDYTVARVITREGDGNYLIRPR